LWGVSFANAKLGVAGGDKNLLRTPDGGKTWISLTTSPLVHVEAVRFTSASHVVGVGFNLPAMANPGPAAMTSDDAGLTWTLHPVPFDKGGQIQDLACNDATCVAVGTGGGGAAGLVLCCARLALAAC